MLTRLGNKRKLSSKLAQVFPKHKMRIEPFFGAGGAYFTLPKPQYAVLNDLDDDVCNLYQVLLTNRADLHRQIRILPMTQSLVKHWFKTRETEPLMKAVRFVFLSNFTYLGKGNTLRVSLDNSKQLLLDSIEETFLHLEHAKITNVDFREVVPQISFSKKLLRHEHCFMYLDPIYLDTEHYYKVPKWTKDDTYDCFELMQNSGMPCGMSEFDHPFIMEQIKTRGLFYTDMGTRQNIKNRRRELFISNYPVRQQIKLEL